MSHDASLALLGCLFSDNDAEERRGVESTVTLRNFARNGRRVVINEWSFYIAVIYTRK